MRKLLLWNNTAYAEILSEKFGTDHFVYDIENLEKTLESWESFDAIVVLCELEWSVNGETNKQQLAGIDMVKALRSNKKVTLPVLFVSFLTLADISIAEREIVTAVGHGFLRLPVEPDDLEAAIRREFERNGRLRRLSEMELMDIRSFYCSKEGMLSRELHDLNNYISRTITDENHDTIYQELEEVIQKIHDLFLADAGNALIAFQMAFPTLTKENIAKAIDKIRATGEALSKVYNDKQTGPLEPLGFAEIYPWSVLLLDDQICEDHELVAQMRANHISVLCASDAETATMLLKADWETENRIMVVIADYRLYETTDGVKRHQKVQGYEFLKAIASSDHLIRLVAFSNLQRKFLFATFSNYNVRTEVKSKTDYLASPETIQLFCEEIIDMAVENLDAIEAMPAKCAGFDKYLKTAYKAFRMHPSYKKREENISLTAKEYADEINAQLKDGLDVRIGAIPHIKSPLAKIQKDNEAYFNRFQDYLVARRIALWLYAAGKKGLITRFDSRRIVEILTDQPYPTEAYRQVLSTNLGLSLDDFPQNITIEERRWLQYEMQLPVLRDITAINISLRKIAQYFGEVIVTLPMLKEQIKQNGFELEYPYKRTIYPIAFDASYIPLLKTATDVRVMYLLTEQHNNRR
jgi:hypothetical protein